MENRKQYLLIEWIKTNKTWVFSGIGVFIITIIFQFPQEKSSVTISVSNSPNAQVAGRDLIQRVNKFVLDGYFNPKLQFQNIHDIKQKQEILDLLSEIESLKDSKNIFDDLQESSIDDLLAFSEYVNGNFNNAIDRLSKSIQQNPNSRLYYNRALCYSKIGKKEDAHSDLKKSVQLAPDFYGGHTDLSISYLNQGDINKAVMHAKKGCVLTENDPRPCFNVGYIYHDILKKPAEAIQWYEKAIHKDESYSRAWGNLGNAYMDVGQNKNATKAYKKALLLNPKDPFLMNNLATLLIEEGKALDAQKYLMGILTMEQSSPRLEDTNPAIYYNLACTYATLKQSDKAFSFLEKATKINFNTVFSTSKIEECFDSLKNQRQWKQLFSKE